MSSCRYIATYWIKNTKIAELYFFDSDMEAQVNKRCCIMDGLNRENMATVYSVVSQVNLFFEIFLRAGEF
jgi:hypothetical protein